MANNQWKDYLVTWTDIYGQTKTDHVKMEKPTESCAIHAIPHRGDVFKKLDKFEEAVFNDKSGKWVSKPDTYAHSKIPVIREPSVDFVEYSSEFVPNQGGTDFDAAHDVAVRLLKDRPDTVILQEGNTFWIGRMDPLNKKAYFQGGGGVNEPTPGQKKYKSDPALVVQPRFKEPFYRNYDLYTIPGMEDIGPGTGWHGLQNYESVQKFLKDRRERLKPRYVADDSWQLDNGERSKKNPNIQTRAAIFNRIAKQAADENDGPNFDYGDGAYTAMSEGKKMKSITDAPHKSPGAFFADDNADHMLPPKEHGTSIYNWRNSLYQGTPGKHKKDSNDIDFPIDEEVNHDSLIRPEEGQYQPPRLVGPSGTDDRTVQPSNTGYDNPQIEFTSPQIAGEHSYTPLDDFDGRSSDALNFGRDYDDESAPIGRTWDESSAEDEGFDIDSLLDILEAKYLDESDADMMLEPAETEIYGLPDGVDSEAKDADKTIQNMNPWDTESDIGTQMYEDKWNI